MSIVAHPPSAVAAPVLMDLTALLLAESRAEFNERIHQSVCHAYAAGDSCESCMAYEAEWLAADLALSAYLGGVV